MALEVVSSYRNIVQHIGELIYISGYRNDYVASKIGISSKLFAVKKQRSSFSVDDIEKILQIIDNEDVDNYLMLQIMRERKDEETISYDDFKEQMGWK
jgi:parvulin-like peptidyl-prolyl isomerase